MNSCEYCGKDFTLRKNLLQHQKTAKFCLSKQLKTVKEYKCEFCNNSVNYSTEYSLLRHQEVCNDKKWKVKLEIQKEKRYKLQDELQELKDENDTLKKEIENLKKQLQTEKQEYTKKLEELLLKSVSNNNEESTNNTRNRVYFNYDRLPTLTTEYLVEATKDFDVNNADLEYVYFTNFISKILKKYVICCDEARRIFIYRHPQPDGTGQLIRQEGGKKLFFYFFEICGQVFVDAYNHHHKIYGNKLNEYIKQYRNTNSKLCEKMSNYCKISVSIDDVIKLKKYDFIECIIGTLAKKLHKNNLQPFTEVVQELPIENSETLYESSNSDVSESEEMESE